MKYLIITGAMAAIMFAGCSKNVSSGGSTTSPTAQADAILQPALTAWQQGDKATAVSNFLAADWSDRPSSVSGSILSLTKDQYHALSDADRQAKSVQVTAQLKALRDMTEHGVEQAGLDAASKGDSAQARKCFMSLKQCGTALDSPDVMQIVQLTGQALKKIADKEMAKISQ
jgi:hypothetical protein